jgi:uncharacterized protein (DUF4415 family)
MSGKPKKSGIDWVDPDDAPEWTEDMFERAEFAVGGKVLRPATGTVRGPGRPRAEKPKMQVSVRLDQDVLAGLRNTGPGWQNRMNEALREWLSRSQATLKR